MGSDHCDGDDTAGGNYGIMHGMRKLRENLPNRVYHLISMVTVSLRPYHNGLTLESSRKEELNAFVSAGI